MPNDSEPILSVHRDQVPRPPLGIRYFHSVVIDDEALPQGSDPEKWARGFLPRYAHLAGGRIIPDTTREWPMRRGLLRRRLIVHVLEAEHAQPVPELVRVPVVLPDAIPPPVGIFDACCLRCGEPTPSPACWCWRRNRYRPPVEVPMSLTTHRTVEGLTADVSSLLARYDYKPEDEQSILATLGEAMREHQGRTGMKIPATSEGLALLERVLTTALEGLVRAGTMRRKP